MKTFWIIAIFAASLTTVISSCNQNSPLDESTIMTPIVDTVYGYPADQYFMEDRFIKNNQFMTDFFQEFGVQYEKILKLESLADSTLSLRKIKAGKSMTCIRDGECNNPTLFVYQPDDYHYVTYGLGDSVYTSITEYPVSTCLESASGTITTNLWNSMKDQGMSSALIDKMEDALAAFDFTTSQVNDRYKLVFDEIYIDGKPKGVGRLHAAWYQTGIDTFMGFFCF